MTIERPPRKRGAIVIWGMSAHEKPPKKSLSLAVAVAVAAPRRLVLIDGPEVDTPGPKPGTHLTTFRALEFFPERQVSPHYTGRCLGGEPFLVPARTETIIEARVNGRLLLKTLKAPTGYRYTQRDEYIAAGEKAPPVKNPPAVTEAVPA